MGICRLHAVLRRLKSRNASALMETLIAFTLIGITSLLIASGLMVSLNIYKTANDLKDLASEAENLLFSASGKKADLYDPTTAKENNQIGKLTYCSGYGNIDRLTGDATSSADGEKLYVYTVCLQKSEGVNGTGILFYYYDSVANGDFKASSTGSTEGTTGDNTGGNTGT